MQSVNQLTREHGHVRLCEQHCILRSHSVPIRDNTVASQQLVRIDHDAIYRQEIRTNALHPQRVTASIPGIYPVGDVRFKLLGVKHAWATSRWCYCCSASIIS
jgi:hypothetical protein